MGELEGGRIALAALHLEHPLLGATALQQQVQSHYLRAALPELVKLVGSANALGARTALAPALRRDSGMSHPCNFCLQATMPCVSARAQGQLLDWRLEQGSSNTVVMLE